MVRDCSCDAEELVPEAELWKDSSTRQRQNADENSVRKELHKQRSRRKGDLSAGSRRKVNDSPMHGHGRRNFSQVVVMTCFAGWH